MKITCCCCGKQAIQENVSITDDYTTTLIGARPAVNTNECYCGHCAKDLDENGLFPEEYSQLTKEQCDTLIETSRTQTSNR